MIERPCEREESTCASQKNRFSRQDARAAWARRGSRDERDDRAGVECLAARRAAGFLAQSLAGHCFSSGAACIFSGDFMQASVYRRVIVITAMVWLPLLVLSSSRAAHGKKSVVEVPFFYDLEMHIRLLVALPLLIIAELFVHLHMRPVLGQFVERDLIPGGRDAALSMRRSPLPSDCATPRWLEVLLDRAWPMPSGVAAGLGARKSALDLTSWLRRASAGGRLQPSLAGWYLGFVSLPIFQFLLVRWYFRVFVWARCLWMVSRTPS